MKGIIKKAAVFILTLMIAVPAITADTDAASEISITGGDSVTGGEIFTVSITYNGDSIGRVTGDVTYDTEMLAYVSGGSSSGNVGYVELKKAGTGEPLTFELKFQALKEGTAELTVSTSEMYDLGEMFMDTPSAVKVVKISGNAPDEEIIKETNPEDDDAAEEGLSVDEKGDIPEEEPIDDEATEDDTAVGSDTDNNSTFIGKAIMYGVIGLVLILIAAALFRRRK